MPLAYNTIRSEILHKRIRVYIQSIYKNQEKALEIERLSSCITGVKYCKANPSTGSVLIIYDNETTDEHLIKRQIYRFISKKLLANLPTNMEAANSLMCKKAVIVENIEKTAEQQIPLAVSNRNISVKSTDNYHSIKVCDIEKKLNTNFINGLSKTQVDETIKELGLNVISEAKKKSIIAKFF